jgi:hypothetical protein
VCLNVMEKVLPYPNTEHLMDIVPRDIIPKWIIKNRSKK